MVVSVSLVLWLKLRLPSEICLHVWLCQHGKWCRLFQYESGFSPFTNLNLHLRLLTSFLVAENIEKLVLRPSTVTLITNPGHENHENTEHEPECTVKMTLSLARQAAWPFGRENLLWLKSCIFMIGGAWIPKKVIKLPSRPPAPLATPFTMRERSYSCKSQWNSVDHTCTKNSWNPIYNAEPIREWSENIRPWSDHTRDRLAPVAPQR